MGILILSSRNPSFTRYNSYSIVLYTDVPGISPPCHKQNPCQSLDPWRLRACLVQLNFTGEVASLRFISKSSFSTSRAETVLVNHLVKQLLWARKKDEMTILLLFFLFPSHFYFPFVLSGPASASLSCVPRLDDPRPCWHGGKSA